MIIIYATLEHHESSDGESLTSELYKLTKGGTDPQLINELSEEVNKSWKKRGIDNISNSVTVNPKTDWRNFLWPHGMATGVQEETTEERRRKASRTMDDDEWKTQLEAQMQQQLEKMVKMQQQFDEQMEQLHVRSSKRNASGDEQDPAAKRRS